jgi:UDP-N-acetylmuramate: L-alanyl-gamma-D-glutamyl-meso-diaminopimelate ligase
MALSPQEVYQQNIDKQRIVVSGSGNTILTKLIVEVLKLNNRKFNLIVDGEVATQSDSPVTIITDNRSSSLIDYKHHIAILTGNSSNESTNAIQLLADATPKSGIILYPESNSTLKGIGSKERADIQSIPYKTIGNEITNGQITLVSSTKEKFGIHLSGNETLELLGAAKEVLKKIGISSGQFYRAVSQVKSL